jgi:hypothetical protein
MDNRPAFTLKRAAEEAGVSRDTIKRRNAAGEFPNAYQDSRGAWMIPITDLIAVGLGPKPRQGDTEQPQQLALDVPQDNDRVRDLEQQLEVARVQLESERALREAAERGASDLRMALRIIEAAPSSTQAAQPAQQPATGEQDGPAPPKRRWWHW